MEREILTPDSPRWQTFTKRLDAALTETGCAGGANKDNAEAVMRDMGGVDIEASLEFFESNGGFCDCEILMNIDPGFWEPMTKAEEQRAKYEAAMMEKRARMKSNAER